MSLDSIGANGIILIVLAVFALLGFLKSLFRLFFNLIALAIGAIAGLWGYNNGMSLAGELVENPEPWMAGTVGVIAFLGAFSIVRMVLGFLSGKSREDGQVRTMGFGLPGGIFGLLLGGFVIYSLLTGVRYAGTVSELERFKDYLSGKVEEGSDQPLFIKLKDWIDNSLLGQWHQKIDFFNDPEQCDLAKLAIAKENVSELTNRIPQIPKAEIVDALPVDAVIKDSIQKGNYSALLKNKTLREKRNSLDDEQRELIKRLEKELGIR